MTMSQFNPIDRFHSSDQGVCNFLGIKEIFKYCENRIYCYEVNLLLLKKMLKAKVEIVYSLALTSLNRKQPESFRLDLRCVWVMF